MTSADGVRHPDHDAVSQELHRWYNTAVPEIGLDGTARRCQQPLLVQPLQGSTANPPDAAR